MRPSLRLRYHQGTTAHTASIYPFSVQGSFGHRGTYVGLDLLAGGGEFCWDPFEAYAAGLVTNPNAWVLGEPGNGKSALVKTLLWRQAAVYGTGPGGRWVAIADPKGEYTSLAEDLGLTTIRLSPGGTATLNPLAPGPAADHEPPDKQTLRRAHMCAALVSCVLERALTQPEDALLFAAVEHLTTIRAEPTLADVAHLVTNPDHILDDRLGPRADLTAETRTVAYAVDKLLTRSLRGMFDGPSTVTLRWDGAGVVLDLSAVPLDSDALPLVMVATAGWFQQLMACPGPQRIQVLDEAWALLGNLHTAAYLQSCFKLGRTYGVANLCITHRASDLAAQADDGTATSKIAAGLLADSATKIILRQAPDQIAAATSHFGLTEPEAAIVTQLARGRALWKLGGRSAVVQHVLAPAEVVLCDTDSRMHGTARARPEQRSSRSGHPRPPRRDPARRSRTAAA
ncbi:MAG: ATP-binding protein [Actinomyces sp.]|nr:MAG: ATP-binding protein [Actinomyces sp.]